MATQEHSHDESSSIYTICTTGRFYALKVHSKIGRSSPVA